jgi:hypothetical protein
MSNTIFPITFEKTSPHLTRQHLKPLTFQHLIDLRLSELLIEIQLSVDKFKQEPIEYLIEFIYFGIAGIIGISTARRDSSASSLVQMR